jgi:uncharacterized protein (TIGR02266 family)
LERFLLFLFSGVPALKPRPPRIPFKVPIEYAGHDLFLPHWSLNLSVGGLFVLTRKPFPKDEILTVRFNLRDLHLAFEIVGHVVWTTSLTPAHPPGMGFSFDWVHPKLRTLLDEFITVSSGLSAVDPRVGNEVPLQVRKEILASDDDTTKVDFNLMLPDDFLV